MSKKGFTLIELLVVIVIIGILVAIALPNFIKIKDKAKEAEVKQNLHAIQLAIERYATDMDGNYPFFLFGGTALFNQGTVNYYDPSSRASSVGFRMGVFHPFDMFLINLPDSWDYSDSDWNEIVNSPEDLQSAFGDTVAYEGYMPKYPTNPFQSGRNAMNFSLDAIYTNFAWYGCYGGEDGRKMWNTAPYGEAPQLMLFPTYVNNDTEVNLKLEVPGNFFYHPRWSDGVTNAGHSQFQAQYNPDSVGMYDLSMGSTDLGPPLQDDDDVSSLDVAGYDLVAYGSPRTKGQDLDNSIRFGDDHPWRTGYLTLGQERNPWVQTGDYPNVDDFDERPHSDAVADFFIIHLGSGMDKKAGNVQDLGN